MRKKLMSFVMVVGALFFVSCDRDETNATAGDGIGTVTHSVRVVTSSFNESIGPISKSGSHSIDGHITRLRYLVFNEWGINLGSSLQEKRVNDSIMSNPDTFGAINLELAKGNYTLVVLGEAKNEDGNYGTYDINTTSKINDIRLVNFNKPGNVGDLFLKIQTLVVGDGDVDVPVRLERVVGQLAVNINENIPVGTAKIDISLSKDVYFYYFGEDRVDLSSSSTYSFAIKPEQIGTFFSEKIHVLNTLNPFTVTVVCTNDAGKVIATRMVNNIRAPKNTRVTLTTDDFFGGSPVSGDVSVSIDPSWGGTPIEAEL